MTGSSRGIGKAIARMAQEQGYRVIVHGRTDSEELQKTYTEIKGSRKIFFDVADKDDAQRAIDSLGHIDVLVNNAGIVRNFIGSIYDVDDNKALDEYQTNILGMIHCIQSVLPSMEKAKQGVVINIASIKGQYNLATTSTLTYAASKAGIISITKALAKTYPNVRFCSVSPGYVETDQVQDWNEETFKRIKEGTLLGRMAQPEEIASMVLFLASESASYITGSDFLVDGGYSIKGK